MNVTELLQNTVDGWLVVGSLVLAAMVLTTMRDEWREGSRVEVALTAVLLGVATYWVGFR